jgi:hypothetical protein
MKETIFVHLSCVVTSLSIRIWWCSRLMVVRRAWKRSAAIIAAAPEEGGSPRHQDSESAQEMRRENQGYQSALSTPWLAQISEPP